MRGYAEMQTVPDDPTQEEAEFLFNVYVDSTRDMALRVTKKVLVALNQQARQPAKEGFWKSVERSLFNFIEDQIFNPSAEWSYGGVVVSVMAGGKLRLDRQCPIDGHGWNDWGTPQGWSMSSRDHVDFPRISVLLPVETRWWMGNRLPALKSAASSGP